MTKSRTLVLALALSLGISASSAGPRSPASNSGSASTTVADVQGAGPWGAKLACGGCVAAGIGIIAGGFGAIWGSLFVTGSSVALGACIAVCAEAF